MKRQPLATAIPEFVILFRVDVRIPMLAAQESTGVAETFEQLIAIFVSGLCQQFQVANLDPAIDGIVWHKLDVISDQRMRLRNLMAVVPEDLELLINEDVPVTLVGYVRDVGKNLMGGEDDLSGILSRIEESRHLRRHRAAADRILMEHVILRHTRLSV